MSARHEIAADVVRRDEAFRRVVEIAGPPPGRRPSPVSDRFASLIRSITFQLLATSAAHTIHVRVVEACHGVVTSESVLRAGPEALRGAGLSRTKAAAMCDLAKHTQDGRVNLTRHGRLSDVDIIAEVTQVHGIGPWTTQMYLMHTMGRRDVWPVGDYGVRVGWSLLHGLDEIVSPQELNSNGEAFLGVRSDVAWYCWRAVHFERSGQ